MFLSILHHYFKKRFFFGFLKFSSLLFSNKCVCTVLMWCWGIWNNKQSVKVPKQGREMDWVWIFHVFFPLFLTHFLFWFHFLYFSGALPHKVSSRFTFNSPNYKCILFIHSLTSCSIISCLVLRFGKKSLKFVCND